MDLCAELPNDITVFNLGIIYEQRFSWSCKRYPGSPRNRIIQAISFQTEDHLVVFAVIKTIVGYPCENPYKILKDIHLKQKSPGTAKRKSNKVML